MDGWMLFVKINVEGADRGEEKRKRWTDLIRITGSPNEIIFVRFTNSGLGGREGGEVRRNGKKVTRKVFGVVKNGNKKATQIWWKLDAWRELRERGGLERQLKVLNLLFFCCWKLSVHAGIFVMASFVTTRAIPVREDANADSKKHVWNDDW